ncbi:UNVERIFIED_CONTAM: hypothetical protein FKN15_062385 [Acipenser sinensis]
MFIGFLKNLLYHASLACDHVTNVGFFQHHPTLCVLRSQTHKKMLYNFSKKTKLVAVRMSFRPSETTD